MFDNLFVVNVLNSQTTKQPTTEGGLTNMIFLKKYFSFFSKIRRNRLEIPSRVVSNVLLYRDFFRLFCVNDNWWNETSASLEGTLKMECPRDTRDTRNRTFNEKNICVPLCAPYYIPPVVCVLFSFLTSATVVTRLLNTKKKNWRRQGCRREKKNIRFFFIIIMSKVLTVLILKDYYRWSRDHFSYE